MRNWRQTAWPNARPLFTYAEMLWGMADRAEPYKGLSLCFSSKTLDCNVFSCASWSEYKVWKRNILLKWRDWKKACRLLANGILYRRLGKLPIQLSEREILLKVHINKTNSDSSAKDSNENTKFKITNKSDFKNVITFSCVGRCSSVGIATRYVPDGMGIESKWAEVFRKCPRRPWGPPSLQHNGYRVFPGGKTSRAWRWPPSLILVPSLKEE